MNSRFNFTVLVFLISLFSSQFLWAQTSVTIDTPSESESVDNDFDIRARVTSGNSAGKVEVIVYDENDQVIGKDVKKVVGKVVPVVEITSPKDNAEVEGVVHVTLPPKTVQLPKTVSRV